MMSSADNLTRSLALQYERHGRWLPILAKLGFALLLARLLAEFIWLWIPVPESAAWKPAPPPVSSTASPAASGPNAELVAGAHLFGEFQAPADPALEDMGNAPDTRLSLNLVGILAANRDEESRALIGTQDGEEKPYSIGGDDVAPGVKLQAIFPDRVILSRKGQLETLRLDKDRAGTPLIAPRGGVQSAPEGNADTAQMLGNIRDQLLNDPSKASDYIRVQPANINGQQRGYRIYPGKDRAVFNGAGLRPGDLVTSVNGVQLDDPSRALQMLGDLSAAGTLNLTVERGGSQQAITVNLN